ncbi:hypothetical protein BDZ45DRAFT_678213 [Acephala macrosclerotiorum]|nr:hypothetical protein BDZ45DRAFT_678213 [Acephala macrosclerotiorum]
MEKTRLPALPAKTSGYSFTLSRPSVYDIPNIRIFSGFDSSLKPIRKFYLKVFAVNDQANSLSKFRQFSAQRRGRCLAEPNKQGQSISFSYVVGRDRVLCSWWFPAMNPNTIRRVFHDPRSFSLKIQWDTGRTLYAQFRPIHYKVFCQLLGLSCGHNMRSSGRDKDLSSWTCKPYEKGPF